MATLTVDLVSPERLLASVEAEMAQIPGVEGEFTALPGHAPFLTTLRPGVVTIRSGAGAQQYFVTGGFAEVSAEKVSILAEEAVERESLTRDFVEAKAMDAEAALAAASEDMRIPLAQRVADFRSAAAHLGL